MDPVDDLTIVLDCSIFASLLLVRHFAFLQTARNMKNYIFKLHEQEGMTVVEHSMS